MSNADGERIAPVTYLFGAPTPGAHSQERMGAEVVSPSAPATTAGGWAEPVEPVERPHKQSFAPINNVSMHALARRGMSSREMQDYLLRREFEPAEVEREVERLESVALLDDVALGETLVRTLRDRKGLGRSALTAELRRRSLDQLAIEIALAGLDDDELERATEIAHKRASQLRSYDAQTARRRLGAFLQRKGYSGSVVSTAVQRALAPAGPTFR